MKGSDPLYAEMKMNLQRLAILTNPECWFDSKETMKGMNDPEIAATKERIKNMLEKVADDSAPYWLVDSDFEIDLIIWD